MEMNFDVIVAGGGIAGVLAAVRLAHSDKQLKICIVEKESTLGGRLRSRSVDGESWGFGLNAISSDLYGFMRQTLCSDPDWDTDFASENHRLDEVGILSGGKFIPIHVSEVFSQAGAKKLGGISAQREWSSFTNVLDPEADYEDKPLTKLLKISKKSPAYVVMEHYASFLGIPGIDDISAVNLRSRCQSFGHGYLQGAWEPMIQRLVQQDSIKDQVICKTQCRIAQAEKVEDCWTLSTEHGILTTKILVVAQSPWQALDWLGKEYWPSALLNIALKTKPVSAVVLTQALTQDLDLPGMILVPSEQAIAFIHKREICFQAAIEYELSHDAPAVVKAVKRLKRARAKLGKFFEGLQTEGEHIALLPVAWAHSPSYHDQKFFEKLTKPQLFNRPNLVFCGDAYGGSPVFDENLTKSLHAACQTVLGPEQGIVDYENQNY